MRRAHCVTCITHMRTYDWYTMALLHSPHVHDTFESDAQKHTPHTALNIQIRKRYTQSMRRYSLIMHNGHRRHARKAYTKLARLYARLARYIHLEHRNNGQTNAHSDPLGTSKLYLRAIHIAAVCRMVVKDY